MTAKTCRLRQALLTNMSMSDHLSEIEMIYRLHAGTVYRIAYSMLKNKHDAEDATQIVFEKLIARWPPCPNDKLIGWLTVCTRNHCKDVIGSAYRKRQAPDDPESVRQKPIEEERNSEVVDAVLALPDELKCLVVLYYYCGYSSVEIARFLDQPETTIRAHIGKARNMMKERLGGDAK